MAQSYAGTQTIVGYFEDQDDAQQALEELRDAGFTSAHLGVAHRGSTTNTASSSVGSTAHSVGHEIGQKTEGVWDKVKNFFEGGSAEPYADERTQGDLANHEVTPNPADDYNTNRGGYNYNSNEAGYGHDDLHGSLTGLSVPEDRARYFGSRFRSGENGAVVTVNAGERAAEAERILRDNGADLGDNAADTASVYNNEYQGPGTTGQVAQAQDVQNIQLLGEVLRVHKDRISRGEVTIRKEVVTETQNIQVPVTREELVIERHPVIGEAQARGQIGQDQAIRIPLTEETASVDKGTVVREEVAVGKKPVGEVRDLSGEIRHEELVVEDQTTTKRAVNQ